MDEAEIRFAAGRIPSQLYAKIWPGQSQGDKKKIKKGRSGGEKIEASLELRELLICSFQFF